MNSIPEIAKNKMVIIFGLLGMLCISLVILLSLISKPAANQPAPLPTEVNVELTDTGFSPKTVTIAKGSAVRWTNKTSKQASVNSDNYPDNQLYRQLNLGLFQPGSTLVLIFNDKGTFGYHDQLNPDVKGSVTVR
jgi:plastocyanin